ncbi:toprim domain-containing protein [Vibrio alfacsensis]|uniref:toprim domain-containing protein n=1 Tax=Vibrio alfacsensis TaxID=1074311 RepID=UPI004067A63A
MKTALDIIYTYQDEFIFSSNQVGIDGSKLLSCLPSAGSMLKGGNVPVLENKYRGTCSVLFYINRTYSGQEYPFVQFRTFKHGGITSEFNGIKYLCKSSKERTKDIISRKTKIQIRQALDSKTKEEEDIAKLRIYHEVQKAYFTAKPIKITHPWLTRRLIGFATTELLARTDIRTSVIGDLFAPLQSAQHGNVGYHKIFSTNEQDHKRHLICKSGRLNGSYIEIRGKTASNDRIAICEGLITGLSIALIWKGPIYVALTANNLQYVRESLNQQGRSSICFFADNDQWKPHVGNVGIAKAKQAMQKGDRLVTPVFSPQALQSKPTDFNDVLLLEGLRQLEKQVLITR